jgi:predicted CopG family antitoxin
MQKKLTITVDEAVYHGLHKVIGRRRISHFIEDLVRPHVLGVDLEAGYQAMAADEEREAEALEWAEALIGDATDATR